MGQEYPLGQDDPANTPDDGGSSSIKPSIQKAPAGEMGDQNDEHGLKHGRTVHYGFKVGQYVQTPPFFFTRDKWPVPLVDNFRGGAAFLVASGPSLLTVDYQKLKEPGYLTMGLNNSVKTLRPNLWTCVDDPANFIRSTFLDPTITKFVPMGAVEKPLFDSDKWKFMETRVGDCPSVFFYKRNERFKAEQYLWEDTINWGNHSKMGGGRSCMLAAVRILFLLGIRKIFLLGVDFNMSSESKYHFDQDRSSGSIKGNNGTYELLQERFTELRPHFEAAGLHVWNCNPTSRLTAFDHMPFAEALKVARPQDFPEDLAAERTAGLYDRKANEKGGKQAAAKAPKEKAGDCPNCSRAELERVKKQVNAARESLHTAKAKTAAMKAKGDANDPSFDPQELNALTEDENMKRKVFRRLLAIRDELQGVKK